MENLLVYPPHWSPGHAYLSLPSLKAYLNEKSIECSQIDLNIEFLYYILSEKNITKIYKNLYKRLSGEELIKVQLLYEFCITNINYAIKIIKDDIEFFDSEKYEFAMHVLERVCSLYSKYYEPTNIGLSYTNFNVNLDVEGIVSIISNTSLNPFITFYKEVLENIKLSTVKFIGISVVGYEQLIPALTLCNILKQEYSDIHITIGGSVFSKLINEVDELNFVFNYIDSILVFEGEEPIYKLIKALKGEIDFKDVPNLIYMNKIENKVIKNKIESSKCIKNLPCPNFDDLDLDKYLLPVRILPIQIARSCYWGKCAFCDHYYGYDGSYRSKSLEDVVNQIEYLKMKYKTEYFHIVDEAIPPLILDRFCDILLNRGVNIRWFNYIRADIKFNESLCNKMKNAGCIQIMIGVESCSDKILNDMDKGINTNDIITTLKNFNENNIWNHVFIINNFPTETYKDKLDSMCKILENKDIFHSIGIGNYTLLKHSKMMKNIHEYNIKDYKTSNQLSTVLNYRLQQQIIDPVDDSLSMIKNVFIKNIPSNYLFHNIIKLREHSSLYSEKNNLLCDVENINKIIEKHLKPSPEIFRRYITVINMDKKLIIYNFFNSKIYMVNDSIENVLNIILKSLENPDFSKNLPHNIKNNANFKDFLKKLLCGFNYL